MDPYSSPHIIPNNGHHNPFPPFPPKHQGVFFRLRPAHGAFSGQSADSWPGTREPNPWVASGRSLGFRGLGFRGLGFWGFGFGFQGLGFRVQGFGHRG